jgi:hypothetical protein
MHFSRIEISSKFGNLTVDAFRDLEFRDSGKIVIGGQVIVVKSREIEVTIAGKAYTIIESTTERKFDESRYIVLEKKN